mmetsp:Transcript_60229/g.131932  ORF Transcript_60229/g.131932 Transcript_60229/m.131932 type:complete len:204 (-) Transcript_60229:222-833(-)
MLPFCLVLFHDSFKQTTRASIALVFPVRLCFFGVLALLLFLPLSPFLFLFSSSSLLLFFFFSLALFLPLPSFIFLALPCFCLLTLLGLTLCFSASGCVGRFLQVLLASLFDDELLSLILHHLGRLDGHLPSTSQEAIQILFIFSCLNHCTGHRLHSISTFGDGPGSRSLLRQTSLCSFRILGGYLVATRCKSHQVASLATHGR